jgi:hypothetical protein
VSDTARERAEGFAPENAAGGIKGCDAVWPYDPDQAYIGMRHWVEVLIAEREALRERVAAAEKEATNADGDWAEIAATQSARAVAAEARAAALEEALRCIAEEDFPPRHLIKSAEEELDLVLAMARAALAGVPVAEEAPNDA